jgi:hypothetical protein
MFTDFVFNGAGHGEVGEQLAGCRFEPSLLRPFVGKNGRKYVTMNVGRDDEGSLSIKIVSFAT